MIHHFVGTWCFSENPVLNANVAMPNRRQYSTILVDFPWYSNALVENPESILAHLDELPGFEVSIISFRM